MSRKKLGYIILVIGILCLGLGVISFFVSSDEKAGSEPGKDPDTECHENCGKEETQVTVKEIKTYSNAKLTENYLVVPSSDGYVLYNKMLLNQIHEIKGEFIDGDNGFYINTVDNNRILMRQDKVVAEKVEDFKMYHDDGDMDYPYYVVGSKPLFEQFNLENSKKYFYYVKDKKKIIYDTETGDILLKISNFKLVVTSNGTYAGVLVENGDKTDFYSVSKNLKKKYTIPYKIVSLSTDNEYLKSSSNIVLSLNSDTFVVKKSNKFALVSASGDLLTKFQYDDIQTSDLGQYFLVEKQQKFGLIDVSGKTYLDCLYDMVSVGEYILAVRNKKTEVFNSNFDFVITLDIEYNYVPTIYTSEDGKYHYWASPFESSAIYRLDFTTKEVTKITDIHMKNIYDKNGKQTIFYKLEKRMTEKKVIYTIVDEDLKTVKYKFEVSLTNAYNERFFSTYFIGNLADETSIDVSIYYEKKDCDNDCFVTEFYTYNVRSNSVQKSESNLNELHMLHGVYYKIDSNGDYVFLDTNKKELYRLSDVITFEKIEGDKFLFSTKEKVVVLEIK